jgi:FlaA1/EpsC-like NDP-sugar epimerase
MGEQIKIVDLARTMIEMAGLEEKDAETPGGDIEIRYVGLRPGEKLYEELLIGNEAAPSEHPRIMCTTEYSFSPETLNRLIENLMQACGSNDNDSIKAVMQNIVREYAPQRGLETTSEQKATSSVSSIPSSRAEHARAV